MNGTLMKKKSVLAIVLALTMAAGLLGGCGSTASTSTDSTASSGSDTAASSSSDTSGGQDSYEVATVRWADWGENYHEGFPDQAAKDTGISIKWDTILNSDWADQKAVLMAGGDLPDAFMGSICFTESDIMTNLGSFIPLDDYIKDNMPNFSKILDSDPTMKALATSSDGHIYGLPAKKPCRPIIANQMFINKTWLDNLGLSVPTTYDEYVKCLEAFWDQDANGNGDPTDEIPYGGGYADPVMFYCLPFGTTIGADNTYDMTIKDGKPEYIPISDSYKAGIEAMHQAYADKLIDQEIFTQDDSMRDAKLMAETPIVGSAAGWTADSTFGANASEYVALPALKGPDGQQYISSDPEHWNYSRYEFVVTTACKDPAKLLAWADQFYTDDASIQNFYGPFDTAVKKNDDGTYEILEPNDGNSADTFAWINSLRDFGPKYVEDGFNDKVKYDGENGDASKLALDKDFQQYAKEAFPNVSYTSDQLNTLSTLYTDISNYVDSMEATWVTEGGASDQWDGYIDQLNSMGLDKFLTIQNDAYNTYEASK